MQERQGDVTMPYIVLMFLTAQFAHANSAPVIISEIGAHETSDYEWVEIYNQSEVAVDLTSWKFFEANTKHGLKASQGNLTIEPKEYAIIANVPAKFMEHHPDFTGTVIDSSWSSLKEAGELIGLIDSAGNHVDEFTYTPVSKTSLQRVSVDSDSDIQWIDHTTSDSAGRENEFNSPVQNISTDSTSAENVDTNTDPSTSLGAGGTESIIMDTNINLNEDTTAATENESENIVETAEVNTLNDSTSESVISEEENIIVNITTNTNQTTQATSSSNIKPSPSPSPTSKVKKPKVVKKKVLPTMQLSEIFPNPYGSDSIYEFFEIENVSEDVQYLKGWQLKTTNQSYFFGEIKIEPHSFYQLTRSESGIAFNNNKETIQLIDPDNKVIDKFKYTDNVQENASYIRDSGQWKLSIVPTRGGINIYVPLNAPPEITAKCFKGTNDQNLLICDASDTIDSDRDQLYFRWNMRGKDDQIIYYWEDDYFEEPYATFKGATMELIVSDTKHKMTKSISIPRRGETIVNIQGVKITVPQTQESTTIKKKTIKKSATKKKSTVKKKTTAKTYETTVRGLVIVEPDKDRKKMTIEFPGLIVSSPRGRLPDVKIGDEVMVKGRLNPNTQQIKISVAEDVSVIFHHAPPQPIVVSNLEDLKQYNYALVSIAGEAQDIYDTGFKIVNENLQLPVYLPPTLHTSPDRFEQQKIVVSGIIKQYRNAPEIVPRSIDDIKIITLPTPEIGHKTVNQFINVWRDWRVGTTLAIAALMTLLSWRIRRLVPAAVRVDATAEGKDSLNILKNRAIGGRPPSILLE